MQNMSAPENFWQIEISSDAGLNLSKMDAQTQKQILDDIHNFVMPILNQHGNGRLSTWNRSDLWPFRSGNHRILCKLLKDKRTVLIMEIKLR